VRLLHELAEIHASFDDPNLVSRAGLVPVMALAQRAGLAALAGERVAIADRCGVNPHLKGIRSRARRSAIPRSGQEPAGAGPERAGRHHQHAAGRPGDRCHPAARRQRELRPRGRVAGHRSGDHRPRHRVHRDGGGAGRLLVHDHRAEEHHRDHAQVEQVFADWTDGPLAHLPSGSFPANAAWAALAAIAHNLLRATGSLASLACAKARGATLRRDLIDVAARHGRGHLTLHLPEGWHRVQEWMSLFEATCGPPTAEA
jgi:hypothetical protein